MLVVPNAKPGTGEQTSTQPGSFTIMMRLKSYVKRYLHRSPNTETPHSLYPASHFKKLFPNLIDEAYPDNGCGRFPVLTLLI